MCSRLIVRRCLDGLVFFLANVSAKKPPLHLVSSCCLRLDEGRTSRAEIPLGRYVFQTGRLKPIFSIRELRVVGFIPKSSAAPSIPLIFQLAFWRTAKMFSRSRRRISASVRYSGSAWSTSRGPKEPKSSEEAVAGTSNSRAPPRAKITARSMTLRSSRHVAGPLVRLEGF